MDPTTAPVLASWHVPTGDAPYAAELARVASRQAVRKAQTSSTSPVVFGVVLGVCMLVLMLAVGPVVLLPLVGVVVLLVVVAVVLPGFAARSYRNQPVSHEPYTATLDADGLHVVSPSVAIHQRWRVFRAAAVDGDVLALLVRGSNQVRVLTLATLDPRVDRTWLVTQVSRLIELDGVHATAGVAVRV